MNIGTWNVLYWFGDLTQVVKELESENMDFLTRDEINWRSHSEDL